MTKTTEHKKSDFTWVSSFTADGQKIHMRIYRAHGTEITIETLDYPHHSQNSEWKGIEIFVYNQTTFHNFHDARSKELLDDKAN
jgi:hypothetical protein